MTLVVVDSGRKRRLTVPAPAYTGDAFPKFSLDGRQLAFARLLASGDVTASDLYVIPVTGGEPRALTSDPHFIGDLDGSSGGQDVLFFSNRSRPEVRLWRAPLSGAEPTLVWPDSRPVIGSSELDDSPQISPDERRIAFSSMRSGTQEIWTCDLDGSNCGRLVSAVRGGTPRWSPDGRFIAYDARPYVQSDVYSVELSTHLVRRLTRDDADDVVPSWSRDGRSVYFASNRTGSWQVFKAPADGGAAEQVTRNGGYAAFEVFEGGVLLYTKFVTSGLFRVPVSGGPEDRVLDQPHCWSHFAVTRDGFLYLDTTQWRAPVVLFRKLGGGAAERVASLGFSVPCAESSLAASPDRRVLLYVAIEQTSDIFQVDGVR